MLAAAVSGLGDDEVGAPFVPAARYPPPPATPPRRPTALRGRPAPRRPHRHRRRPRRRRRRPPRSLRRPRSRDAPITPSSSARSFSVARAPNPITRAPSAPPLSLERLAQLAHTVPPVFPTTLPLRTTPAIAPGRVKQPMSARGILGQSHDIGSQPHAQPAGLLTQSQQVGSPGGGRQQRRSRGEAVLGHAHGFLCVFPGTVQRRSLVRAHRDAYSRANGALVARDMVLQRLLPLLHCVGRGRPPPRRPRCWYGAVSVATR